MQYRFPLILTTRRNYDQQFARQTMEAYEQVAEAMGAEVHDDLIQKLTVFTLNIDKLERSVQHPKEVDSLILKMRSDLQEMVSSVRNISRNLMPSGVKGEKLSRDLGVLCENLERPDQGRVHYENFGEEIELGKIAKRYLHRIVQELVHNAFKHSSAWHVWVTLRWAGREMTLEVEDDGTAFHVMQDRIALLENKFNTLKMRSMAIGAELNYHQGAKGLLARLVLSGI
ncbi:MAG TPA: ATP-binding protein [Cyclobacteriaceae bacterium]|nr:ATP-binding protein [Cyclobacteriaceae bacterium]